MKVAVIFGGSSNEHQISIISATSVIANLDKEKYMIYPIYLDKDNQFYEYTVPVMEIQTLKLNSEIKELKKIPNIITYLNDMDVIFPVLHGRFGEDGTLQGMLELMHKKYVGCGVLASAICMDKEYTKAILKKAGIPVSYGGVIKKYQDKYCYVNDNFEEIIYSKDKLLEYIEQEFSLPIYLKASNSGSSVGVHKVEKREDFFKYLDDCFKYDTKVLVEKGIKGREIECAILGNEEVIASPLGEILTDDNFYSFSSKYQNSKINTQIVKDLPKETVRAIQDLAKKAFRVCNCSGLARVDFFLEDGTNKIILNEINTMPGFTKISMYPKLMEECKISYKELLDKLIALALEK